MELNLVLNKSCATVNYDTSDRFILVKADGWINGIVVHPSPDSIDFIHQRLPSGIHEDEMYMLRDLLQSMANCQIRQGK